jgi:8-oxo-dGTP pyrophosphatase MutT (NUDIX family)
MNLFINDIPVTILKAGKKPAHGDVNHVVDAAEEKITKALMINHVWVRNVGVPDMDIILDLLDSGVPLQLISLVISVKDIKAIKDFLRRRFKVVDAAGGLVIKRGKFLMIHRMKKWDLPKGKRDPGESSRQTAVREVNEECGIEVKLGKRIVTTWHTYTMNKNMMLKRTRWYAMELTDDSQMKPEKTEDIEEVRWMTRKEVYHALENSYNSIRFVFSRYYAETDNRD